VAIDLPEPLETAIKDGKCVLFVGSGLSAAAGYPTWESLIKTLVDAAKKIPHARIKGIEEYESDKDYFTLAEFARSALGPNQYINILRQEIGKKAKPTETHKAIASTKYRGIITTNYDRLLETVFTQVRGWAPNDFTPESVSSLATALYNPEVFIFKFHGNITSPETIVLTSRDYDRLILLNPHVRSFMQAIFLNYTLFFVGYGIRDPDFKLVLGELTIIFQGFTPTHYALLPNAPEFSVEDMMKRMNIQTIPYDPVDGHKEVFETLDKISKNYPYVIT
jgi:hypothetical protein